MSESKPPQAPSLKRSLGIASYTSLYSLPVAFLCYKVVEPLLGSIELFITLLSFLLLYMAVITRFPAYKRVVQLTLALMGAIILCFSLILQDAVIILGMPVIVLSITAIDYSFDTWRYRQAQQQG